MGKSKKAEKVQGPASNLICKKPGFCIKKSRDMQLEMKFNTKKWRAKLKILFLIWVALEKPMLSD